MDKEQQAAEWPGALARPMGRTGFYQWTFEESLVNALIKNTLALLPDSKYKYINITNIQKQIQNGIL